MKDNRDALDFGTMDVQKLYFKILTPTVLGMVATIVVTLTDGIFVGQYAGEEALAAVNISVPFFLVATGFALMFGSGCSVVASTHLAQGNIKAANINVTQTFIVSLLLFATLSLVVLIDPQKTALLLGSSEKLLPLVVTYVSVITPSLVFYMLMNLGLFLIRLDGSPKYAMFCCVVPAILNIIGDFLFVGVWGWGLTGAVWATAGSYVVGGLMPLIYFLKFSNQIKLYRLKFSKTSLYLTARNMVVICKLGFPALMGEFGISLMVFVGNLVMAHHLGDDGIAAFAVACYCFPIAFMINNAVAQSAQPIISYNIKLKPERSYQAKRLSLKVAAISGIVLFLGTAFFAKELTLLFMKPGSRAFEITTQGLPLFALGYFFFAMNMAYIGYYLSVEQSKVALFLTVVRGYFLPMLGFVVAPLMFGVAGIWLAVPLAEMFTLGVVIGVSVWLKKREPIVQKI